MPIRPSLPHVLPVVLGYSRFASTTMLCLDSLLPQIANLGQTVLAVDNGSPDDSAELLKQYAQASPYTEHLDLRFHSKNLGFGGGMNAAIAHGLEAGGAQWVLLINSDTMFPPGALEAWLRALSVAPPDIGLIGPLTNNAGNAQKLIIKPKLTSTELDFDYWANASRELMQRPTNLLWPLQRADFFCVAIRTHVWNALGGLDLAYGRGYYEDFDFSVRAWAAGYQSALTEDSFVYHQGSAVFKANPEQKELIRKNKKLLLSRFPSLDLPHVRQDNFALLQQQLLWLQSQPQVAPDASDVLPALKARMQYRWLAALEDLPRSPLKRWLWRRRLSAVLF